MDFIEEDNTKQDFLALKMRPRNMLLLALLVCTRSAIAATFVAGIDESSWVVEPSPLECRLQHRIPAFGQAVFVRSAGRSLSFRLESWQSRMRRGNALVAAESPPWKAGNPTRLGEVRVTSGRNPVRLGEELALRVLDALGQGKNLVFAQPAGPDSASSLQVALSAVNFRGVYREYMDCMAGLLPVSFAEASRSALLFGDQQWEISASNRERLDLIARYVEADPGIGRVLVDGHTDRRGRADDNRRLSRQRAHAVTAYLIAQGVPEGLITTRYHGERYPVAGKRAAEARNRRVSVRLERRDPGAGLASGQVSEVQTRPRFDASL